MNTMFIDPGRLNSELVLERLLPLSDGMGGYNENWQEIAVFWGRVEPVSDVQKNFAAKAEQVISHRITLRFRNDVKSGMRLRKNERIFVIRTVHDPDESQRYTICLTGEEGR